METSFIVEGEKTYGSQYPSKFEGNWFQILLLLNYHFLSGIISGKKQTEICM